MEDILASIRRILAEEEGGPPAAPTAPPAPAATDIADGVLQLDASMMLPDAVETPAPPLPEDPPPPALEAPLPSELVEPAPPSATLMAPEAAAATATFVGSLVRTLAAERTMQVHSGGPTVEDIVRAELRPLLKQWLDAHLPAMVERLVRIEIERVVGRVVP
jgi:cell pole-organizing protein PopZ